MKIKLTTFTLFIFFTTNCFSQEDKITLFGIVYSYKTPIANVHIYNVSEKLGAISNESGEFKLQAAVNDTLYVSSLGFEKVYVQVTEENIKLKQLNVELVPIVNELDEVFLRHLTGDLKTDLINKPKDTIPKMGYVYSKDDLNKTLPKDSYSADKRPNAQAITDPLGPIGGGASLPNRRYQKEQKLKREIERKSKFPEKIIREFGITYFTEDLNIPKEKINNFIGYCEYRKIYEKYYNNQVLEVIEILKEESINYNAIKN